MSVWYQTGGEYTEWTDAGLLPLSWTFEFHETPMDDSDEPEVELPPIYPITVDGAQGLPDDVKNGDPTEPTETYE